MQCKTQTKSLPLVLEYNDGTYLQQLEKQCHGDAGKHQEIADDDGGTRTGEEVTEEEPEGNLGVAPEEEDED